MGKEINGTKIIVWAKDKTLKTLTDLVFEHFDNETAYFYTAEDGMRYLIPKEVGEDLKKKGLGNLLAEDITPLKIVYDGVSYYTSLFAFEPQIGWCVYIFVKDDVKNTLPKLLKYLTSIGFEYKVIEEVITHTEKQIDLDEPASQ